MSERHADLMRQGFMKTGKRKGRPARKISDAEWGASLAAAARARYADLEVADQSSPDEQRSQ